MVDNNIQYISYITRITQVVEPVLNKMRIELVEAKTARHKGTLVIILVVYMQGGISLAELSKSQKILRPILELHFGRDNLSVEISSPGSSRVLKNVKEYQIFDGRHVRVLVDNHWHSGILCRSDSKGIALAQVCTTKYIQLEEIRKIKLDGNQEI